MQQLPSPATIGWIGTGVMGRSMAGHLIAAGHRLRVHTRSRHKAGPPDVAPGDDKVADMTREAAAEILGVAPHASRDDIIAAHARQKALRQADGASRWATARLDRARDVLLSDDS